MGGFTFYTLFVIPTGAKVLGSDRDQGFITQQVTNELNYIGCGVLVLLWVLLLTEKRGHKLHFLWLVWAGMVALQAGLFFFHNVLDGMLDTSTHKIHDLSKFFPMHRTYMATASLQWALALAYLWCSLRLWRRQDGSLPAPAG